MRIHAFGLCLFLSALTVFAAQTAAQPGKDSDEELAKKIQRLRDQLDPLIQEQKNRNDKLLEQQRAEAERKAREEAERKAKEEAAKKKAEAERQAKEATEKKKHVIKVEIRGQLGKGPETLAFGQNGQAWYVTINDLKWRLDFGAKKDLAAEALKLAGKPVVITGTVVNIQKTPQLNPYQLQPAPAPWMPFPGGPQQPILPQPRLPQPPAQYNPYLIPYQVLYPPPPITINVESLKAAPDLSSSFRRPVARKSTRSRSRETSALVASAEVSRLRLQVDLLLPLAISPARRRGANRALNGERCRGTRRRS